MDKSPKQNPHPRGKQGVNHKTKSGKASPAGDPASESADSTEPCTSRQASEREERQKSQKHRPGAKGGSKSGGPDQWIKSAVEEYYLTQHYQTAVAEGFSTFRERIRFNTWVLENQASIDPKVGAYCKDCGEVSLLVCKHRVKAPPKPAVELVDPAVLFSVPTVVSWRFTALEQLRNMFRLPRFNPAANRNPDIGGFSSDLVGDELVNDKMASFIRLHLNTSYVINGVYDREAKISHCHKLALRFCDEEKIRHEDRCQPGFVNSMQFTVQRCADSGMEEMLFTQSSGVRNGFWKLLDFHKARPSQNQLIMAGVLLFAASPILRRRVITAVVKTKLFIFRKYCETNMDIALIGSVQALRSTVMLMRYVGGVIATSIWNLIAKLC